MLSTVLIIRIILLTLGTASLSYFSYRFWKLRNNFLISARSPIVSLFATIILHTSAISVLIRFILEETGHSEIILSLILISITGSFAYLSCALIIYRLLLIYHKSITSDYRYQNRLEIYKTNNTDVVAPMMQNTPSTNDNICTLICKTHWNKIISSILFVQVLFFCVAYHSDSLILISIRLLNWIVYIICACIILYKSHKRLHAALFCLFETYVMICGIISALLFAYVFSLISQDFSIVFSTVMGIFIAHSLVCIPLYVIRKNRLNQTAGNNLDVPTEMRDVSKTELSISSPSASSVDVNQNVKPKPNNLPLHLHQYLKIKENFEEFELFLASVFALEGLMFLVRVINFRTILLEHIRHNKQSETPTESVTSYYQQIYAMKFDYLNGVYNDTNKPKQGDNKQTYRKYVGSMAQNIYDEFIAAKGEHEINISSAASDKVKLFFEGQIGGEKHVEMEEYLTVFEEAAMETYILLTTVYKYRFKFAQKQK